jgi:DNA-binding response OmpR family regulator
LSARGAELDEVTALDLGADDDVTKPFAQRCEDPCARVKVTSFRGIAFEAFPPLR